MMMAKAHCDGFVRLGMIIVSIATLSAPAHSGEVTEAPPAPKKSLAEKMGLAWKAPQPAEAKLPKVVEAPEEKPDPKWYPRTLGEIKGVLATLALPGNHGNIQELYLNRLKAYRFICEVSYEDITWNKDLEECVRLAIEAFHMNNEASHGPKKPAQMSDADYKKAQHGAGGNLFGGLTHPTACVDGWMYDSAFGPANAVGHRRWCINPAMKTTAFASKWPYAVMQFDGSRQATPDWDYVAFPARGYMPVELNYMGAATAWSVSLNMSKYESPQKDLVKVTVQTVNEKLENVGEPFPLDCLTIDHTGFGSGPAIVFRPEGGFGPTGFKMKPDVRCKVTIDGLKSRSTKQPVQICYLVHFIEMKSVPHSAESRRIVSSMLRKRLDAIKAISEEVDKWEALTAFAAADLLNSAEPALAKEAQEGIAQLLKSPVVRKEHDAAQKRQFIVEMEQKARKEKSKIRKKETLTIVATAYRDLSNYFKDTRAGKESAEDFERLKKELH